MYFALSSQGKVLYIARAINIQDRLKGHHRLQVLKAFKDVKIAWLTESDSLALRRIETILIEYFNPPLNKIPSYLKEEDTEKLVKYLTISDRAPKNNVISIDKFLTSTLDSPLEQELLSHSDVKEVILEQSQKINQLEDKIADLQSMLQEQMQVHRQPADTLIEQAKTISELSRTQAQTNSRLVEVTVEQAQTISKLSGAL